MAYFTSKAKTEDRVIGGLWKRTRDTGMRADDVALVVSYKR